MSSHDGFSEDDPLNRLGANGAGRALQILALWEIQELAAAAILIVVAVLAITGVTSAVVGAATQNSGFPGGEPTAQILIQATQWAGIFAPFLVLCALGLAWWQVDGWTEALDEMGDGDDRADGGGWDEVRKATAHLDRNRVLATWAGVSLLVVSMGNIGLLVGVVVQDSPGQWQQWISAGGQLVAALVLAGVGFVAVIHIWRLTDSARTGTGTVGPDAPL